MCLNCGKKAIYRELWWKKYEFLMMTFVRGEGDTLDYIFPYFVYFPYGTLMVG